MRKILRKPSRRSGMALMLVIPAVALTTVLAYAVLTNTGTQDQISSNAQLLGQADCAAESGINYGLYSLQQEVANQTIDPITFTQTDQVGNTQQSFTVTVVTTKDGLTINATITAVGTISKDANTIKRTLMTNVQLNLAADFGGGPSNGLTATTGPTNGRIISGQGALTSGSSGPSPVTSIQVLNWAQ